MSRRTRTCSTLAVVRKTFRTSKHICTPQRKSKPSRCVCTCAIFRLPNRGTSLFNGEQVFYLLLFIMIIAQLLLVYWRKRHYKSYQPVTLLGLWVIPFIFSASLHFWKVIFLHALWTCGSAYTMYKATRRPLPDRTPRLVYSFFFYCTKVPLFVTIHFCSLAPNSVFSGLQCRRSDGLWAGDS